MSQANPKASRSNLSDRLPPLDEWLAEEEQEEVTNQQLEAFLERHPRLKRYEAILRHAMKGRGR